LSEARLRDVDILVRHRRFAAAYYLLGYSVECAIKSIIARRTKKSEFPPREAKELYTHDLSALLAKSGVSQQIEQARRINRTLDVNWKVVLSWKSDSRYEPHSKKEATDLFSAVTEPKDGVLACVKRYW